MDDTSLAEAESSLIKFPVDDKEKMWEEGKKYWENFGISIIWF